MIRPFNDGASAKRKVVALRLVEACTTTCVLVDINLVYTHTGPIRGHFKDVHSWKVFVSYHFQEFGVVFKILDW